MTALNNMPAVSSPRCDAECTLKITNGVGPSYETSSHNATTTTACHESIKSWHGGVSSSKRKELLRLKLMKRRQPEIKKNLDSLKRSWISLRGTYGPYYLPSLHQLPAVLLPALFFGDGTYKLSL